jgi:transcriptional regulator with XRE-family HTH domain
MTQAQVARLAGISRERYGRIERGRVDPSLRVITRIAFALSTTPADLLAGVE